MELNKSFLSFEVVTEISTKLNRTETEEFIFLCCSCV